MERIMAALLLVVIALVAFTRGEVIKYQSCSEPVKCTVQEVRVDPCPEAAQDKPCLMLKGSNATIAFDYTPEFDAQTATAKAFWTQTAMDLPFAGMDNEGCKYTSCPIVAGQRQSYSYNLPIQKKYPSRTFDVKWQLMNEAEEMCCFIIQIAIKDKKAKKGRN
ncbi:MD-2-related lipid-recognition protein-like [Sabethes cyaneus]|uniref:MD-2-related lipid-recognition protein-like n=1 Tax=Sabethes cyaneus TaxID=53552 RepID=UPI00237D4257|nr:MD-2-related lipid-recognition protein-like [Sabethes cyaneus]